MAGWPHRAEHLARAVSQHIVYARAYGACGVARGRETVRPHPRVGIHGHHTLARLHGLQKRQL